MGIERGGHQRYQLGRVVPREIGTWCDPNVLAANRAGRLTSSQRELLLAHPTRAGAISLGVLALVPLGLALFDVGIAGFASYMRAAFLVPRCRPGAATLRGLYCVPARGRF
jgi:hypothetical protein